MLSKFEVLLISLAYLSLIFLVAYLGDRLRERSIRKIKPIVIGLGVTIYCSAWSFYGTTAQAADNGWYFPPTFLGSIILVAFFAPQIRKLIQQSKRTNVTSIADYIAVNFGHSRTLAVLITVVSLALLIPYIALQLKAITESYQLLSAQGTPIEFTANATFLLDEAFWAALILGVFAIAFGTRHLDSREHHNGLMLAIAFEALIKITAFMFLAWFVSQVMFDGVEDIFIQAAQNENISLLIEQRKEVNNGFFTALVLGFIATVCLPRQFHVLVVESDSSKDFDTVRWLFPFYLIIFGACMLPVAYAGLILFDGQDVSSEQFVLQLPMLAGRSDLALMTYIGGLSAGSSMVIVACVAMATMACNELAVPLLLRTRWADLTRRGDISQTIRRIRRGIILLLMLLAYVYYRLLASGNALGTIGLLSFALVAQFAPCIIFSLLLSAERREHLSTAAIAGISAGFLLWCYTLLVPLMARADLLSRSLLIDGPFGFTWLKPTALFGLHYLNELSHGVLWSLTANIASFLYFAKKTSSLFSQRSWRQGKQVPVASLRHLLVRFVGAKQASLALVQYPHLSLERGFATSDDIQTIENILSGVIGNVSARYVIEQSLSGAADHDEVLVKTSEIFQFSRELLQTSIDSISQGISVVDAQLTLVAWNKSYVEVFDYPEGLVHVGRPVADLINYNAKKNGLDEPEIEDYTQKRLTLMAAGSAYVHNYIHHDGRVLEIQGAPMGEGGFVTTFTDITAYQDTLNALEEARLTLETRVEERTRQLKRVNQKLRQANKNKTHFLAAAGHDLIQPLNAAKLFVSALVQRQLDEESIRLLAHLDQSLQSADAIIGELLAIAKLDSGEMRVNPQTFCIGALTQDLQREFSIIAQKKHLSLRAVYSSMAVTTDEKLLKRILQNLLSNAIRYTDQGRVVVGCRRKTTNLCLEVWDTGCGIPETEQDNIFLEFHRLNRQGQDGGLGLGLATVQRLCQLLDIKIDVASQEGKGSVFRLILPRSQHTVGVTAANDEARTIKDSALAGMRVLCVDNEPTIVKAMRAILEPWGCEYVGGASRHCELPWVPDVLLVDYHLDSDDNGIAVAKFLRDNFAADIPVVVISADQDNKVRSQAKALGYFFLRKPLKVAALWSVLARIKNINAASKSSPLRV